MATLRVKSRGLGPMFYGRWRDGSRMIERPIGRGWLVGEGEPGGKPNGKSIGTFRERAGRPATGFLTIQAATQALVDLERTWREEQRQEQLAAQRASGPELTVREAADRYLEWGERDDPYTAVYKLVNRAALTAGVPDRLCHPHALRSYLATTLLEDGVAVHVVQAGLGHAELSTTGFYAVVRPEHQVELVDVLDRRHQDARRRRV